MKQITIIAIAIMTIHAQAGCESARSQMEMNECSRQEVKVESERLIKKLREVCDRDDEIAASRNGSIYPLLMNLCLRDSLKDIRKKIH